MVDTVNDQINQVVDPHQGAFVVDGAQRKGNTFPNPTNQAAEIARRTGAVDQRRTDDHDFHPRLLLNLPESLLCFPFGLSIGLSRIGLISCSEWTITNVPVDAD